MLAGYDGPRRCRSPTRLAAWVEAFVRRALAEPVRAYALIAEPVDPAVEAERLDLPPRVRRPLRRAPCARASRPGDLPPLDAERHGGGDRRRRWPRRSSARSQRRDTGVDALVDRPADPSSSMRWEPVSTLVPTHEVANQSRAVRGRRPVRRPTSPLREALEREGARLGGRPRARRRRAWRARPRRRSTARRAERNEPRLVTHDRYGHRVDEVELDPSWHWLLRGAVEREIHALPWRDPRPGAHVARAALELLWTQANAGVMCPVSMTYSAVPALRRDPELAAEWEPRLTLPDYERGALCGMAMTEKQGGSDVRANTTRAEPAGDGWCELTGHKWFCSHPTCDVFLVLAQAPAGLSCFLVERGPGLGDPAPQGQARHALAGLQRGRVPRRCRAAARARRAAASRRSSRWSPTRGWTA